MENLITADVGGSNAERIFQRLGEDATFADKTSLASVATNGQILTCNDNILAIVGTPLPAVRQAPENWKDAMERLPAYDGCFSMFYWDKAAGKLVVISDFMGFYPLYFKREQGRIFFSSATRAFDGDFNPASWGAFITLGQTMGASTLTDGVELVAPASLIVIDLFTREMEVTRYWRSEPQSTTPSVDQVNDALRASTEQIVAAHPGENHYVMMSGGMDSRLIAYMLSQQDQSFRGVLVSHYDEHLDAETRFGRMVAKKLGFACEYQAADRNFFSSKAFLDYLFCSDAETPSLYLFISQVLQFIPEGVVWDGFIPGTLLKNNVTKISPNDPASLDFDTYLKKLGASFDGEIWSAARKLFKPEVAQQFEDAFLSQWDSLTSEYPNDEDGISDFHFDHRNRTRTLINPLKAFRTRAKMVTPGITREFVELARAVPEREKRQEAFYKRLYDRHYPEANTIPVVTMNRLIPPRQYSLSFEAFKLFNKIHSQLRGRPRAMRYLGIDPYKYRFRESSFLKNPQLYSELDPALDQDFLKKLQRGDVISPQAVKLLFHWRVWRWLHDQKLYEHLLLH